MYYYNYFFQFLNKLFFFSPILTNNNIPLKIYCENIVKIFLNFNFLFFILCFPYFILFFYPYFLLFFPFFSHPHTYPSFFFFIFFFPPFPCHFLHTRAPTFLFIYFLTFPFHLLHTTPECSTLFKPLSHSSSYLNVLCISFFFFLTLRS